MPSFVPTQSQTAELLDVEPVAQPLLRENLHEMARANRWLGAQHAMVRRVAGWLATLPPGETPRILDVATGGADLPIALDRWSAQQGRRLSLIAGDLSPAVLAVAQHDIGARPIALVCHDALRMPFADGAVDIVTCTQALHHFNRDAAVTLLREFARVARLGVIISDLRRSYLAYWGARLLAYGPVSALARHDGPLSVLRAYTPPELVELVRRAALPAQVRRAPGFRVEVRLDKTTQTALASAAPRRAAMCVAGFSGEG